MFHSFTSSIQGIPLPQQFTYPFYYTPHPLCVQAANEVQHYLAQQTDWKKELAQGKMFGVLLVRNTAGEIGYLAAFSGILARKNKHPFFVPPVFDLLNPQGAFKIEEKQISAINIRIAQLENNKQLIQLQTLLNDTKLQAQQALTVMKEQMKIAKQQRDLHRQEAEQQHQPLTTEQEQALIRESQYQKAEYKRNERNWKEQIVQLTTQLKELETPIHALKEERKQRSAALQQWLFAQFDILNARGERRNLLDIFKETVFKTPPAGAGECAAPKLLQYAYLNHYEPLAMAEFWWGASPKTEIRHHGHYYPSCKGKCEPILSHMLQGLDVEPNPLLKSIYSNQQQTLDIVYEDDVMLIINKPAGMLSVPGKEVNAVSVYSLMQKQYPQAEGPLIVHRLDMATSGLLLIAKTKEIHQALQAQFHHRHIKKRYIAWLDGIVSQKCGTIDLPLCLNPLDRPRQMVNKEEGKPALTFYKVLERNNGRTRIAFYPHTGRTHQLRVHAAHPLGLHCPIIGDTLYGKPADRLYLHAEALEFTHPITGKRMMVEKKANF